jgi:hypothetical protein
MSRSVRRITVRGYQRAASGTFQAGGGLDLWRWPKGGLPMDENTKSEIWDLAAGTFIAVSVVSSMAFIIANALR